MQILKKSGLTIQNWVKRTIAEEYPAIVMPYLLSHQEGDTLST